MSFSTLLHSYKSYVNVLFLTPGVGFKPRSLFSIVRSYVDINKLSHYVGVRWVNVFTLKPLSLSSKFDRL